MAEHDCNTISLVLRMIFTMISIALVIFFSRLFWRLRTHFLISSRFPNITIISISLINYILMYDVVIDYAVCYGNYREESTFGMWFHSFTVGM